jgi:hypothetical protein
MVTSNAEGMPTRQGEAPAEGRTTRSVDDSEAGVRAKPVALDTAYMLGDLPSLPLSFLVQLPSSVSEPSSSVLSNFFLCGVFPYRGMLPSISSYGGYCYVFLLRGW